MALVGYARVSSVGQTLAVQLDKLQHCDKIFQEKKSSVSGKRPRLDACLEYVREGDTLVVTRLDSTRWGLVSYFADWWDAEMERKTAIAHTLQHFYTAAAEHDALEHLGVTAVQIAPWQRIAPLPPDVSRDGFPGLQTFLPPGKNRPRRQGNSRTTDHNENQPSRYPVRRQTQINDNPLLTNPTANPNALTNRLRRTKELAQQGKKAAIPGLIAALDDPVSTVRYLARSALVNIGGAAVGEALREYMDGEPTPDGVEEAGQVLKYLS